MIDLKNDDEALKTASEDEVRPEASPATEEASGEVEEPEAKSESEVVFRTKKEEGSAEEEPTETEKKVQKKGTQH